MPCYSVITTSVDINASTMNRARLEQAARDNGATLKIEADGSAKLIMRSSYQSADAALVNAVKRTYAEMTVKAGLARSGFKVKGRTEANASRRQNLTIKVGR